MGMPKAVNPAAAVRAESILWPLFAGVPVGLCFLLVAQLETKWFFFLFLGGLALTASLAPVDRKACYLTLLVFSLPLGVDLNLYFQPSPFRHSTQGFSIQLNHILLAALYIIWGFRAAIQKLPLRISTIGLMPLLAVFASGTISVFLAKDPLFGVFDLFALSLAILLFIYTASEVREPGELRLILSTLMVVMALQGIIAIGQHFSGSALGLEFFGASERFNATPGLATLTRVGGTLGHPNSLALFFDLLLPLGFSLLFCRMSRARKLLFLVAVGLGMLGLAVTLSRGGTIVVGLALPLILLVRWRKRIGLLRAGLAVAFIGTLPLLVLLGPANPIQERFLENDYGSAYGRIPHMQVAFNIIRHHPFFGVGLNNYTEVARQYDHTPEQIISLWNSPVHNLFLFIAGEIGLVGLGLFFALLLTIGRALLPAIRSPDPLIASTGLGLLLGLLAFFIHAQVDYSNWPLFSPLWFLLGLAVSVGRLASLPSAAQAVRPS
jgi:putative inorganic carbon (hco3(-)) transporter